MKNLEKYQKAFIDIFEIDKDQLNQELEYQSINAWDSVGHMALMAELEDIFEIEMEMDDIVDFGTYATGIETMRKYGVDI
jgi:acyl carrier protein